MKRILFLTISLLAAVSCYDDSALRETLKEHEERISALETLCAQLNTNITALQTVVSALENNVYVTAVTPVKGGDDIIGYTISFTNSESVTIYNGENGADGKDGASPLIGVRQDADGIYYWTLNAEWLTDSAGNKVRASAQDGADGKPGEPGTPGASGVTPKLKIVDGYWYVSYDGGKTWEEETLGQATGEKGDSMFSDVTYDDDFLYITMADGETLSIPRKSSDSASDGPLTWSLDKVTAATATFTGHLDVPASDLSFSQVTVCYSDAETFNMNAAESVSATSFDSEQNFTITLTALKYDTKYNYCIVAEVKSEKIYSDVLDFTTLKHPYDIQHDLNVSAAKDMSSSGSANCYIVSESGLYKFKTVKGNSNESVGSVAWASILWETFGTSETPEYLDLIKAFCYKDGCIAFQTADTFKEGNAVIAAKDADGNILWSWHIWFTDQPQGQEYYNNAGIMMDRNLGATSATPGDVGALGLLYQWGRKDPFLGSSSIHYESMAEAKSTITWPSAVVSNSSNGTIEYATAHPTTFITRNIRNSDWYYTGSSSTDNTRWTTSESTKSIYDPCPAGWRVPDGESNGVWLTALGSSSSIYDDSLYSSTNEGMNFSGRFGSASTIWYPASGCRYDNDGSLGGVGYRGYYWSASPYGYDPDIACILNFYYDGRVDPSDYSLRAGGLSVRCLQE